MGIRALGELAREAAGGVAAVADGLDRLSTRGHALGQITGGGTPRGEGFAVDNEFRASMNGGPVRSVADLEQSCRRSTQRIPARIPGLPDEVVEIWHCPDGSLYLVNVDQGASEGSAPGGGSGNTTSSGRVRIDRGSQPFGRVGAAPLGSVDPFGIRDTTVPGPGGGNLEAGLDAIGQKIDRLRQDLTGPRDGGAELLRLRGL